MKINCEICNREVEYGNCFGNRCPDCEYIGYSIYGFGEAAEYERNQSQSIEEQRAKIMEKFNRGQRVPEPVRHSLVEGICKKCGVEFRYPSVILAKKDICPSCIC